MMSDCKTTEITVEKTTVITECDLQVKESQLHGQGVFVLRPITQGERIIEYKGEHITWEEADERHPNNAEDPYHTFYFQLECGDVIDGAVGGNISRWINHSCNPNTEAYEEDGGRVFIYAIHDIAVGEELTFNYRLVLDEALTPEIQACYRCACGGADCQGTMLSLTEEEV